MSKNSKNNPAIAATSTSYNDLQQIQRQEHSLVSSKTQPATQTLLTKKDELLASDQVS